MPNEVVRIENQKRVLEKAIELFAKNGIERTSLSDIAKEAGVSLRSVFRYYKNKDILIAAVVDVSLQAVWNDLNALNSQEAFMKLDGAKKITEMVRTMLRFAKDDCQMQTQIIASESYLDKIGVRNIFSLSDSPGNIITQSFVKVFKEGVADGSIKRDVIEYRRKFFAIAVTYRGFYNRIAVICSNEKMRADYEPDYLIEDFAQAIYEVIATKPN